MLRAPVPSAYYNTSNIFSPASVFMQNTRNLPDASASSSGGNSNSNNGMMLPPPPMPRGVSFKAADERSYSLPVVPSSRPNIGGRGGRSGAAIQPVPSNHRSVSFSDTVSTVNFPVLPNGPACINNNNDNQLLPGGGRIVSSSLNDKDNLLRRANSIESLGGNQDDLDLSFSSLSSTFMNDDSATNNNNNDSKSDCDCKSTPANDPMLEPTQIKNCKQSQKSSSNCNTSTNSFSACFEDDMRTILHRACQQFPRKKSIVKNALKKDPSAVRRRAFIPGVACTQKSNNTGSSKRAAPEPYQLPINIALVHKASLDVLDMLVKADATQLAEKDGINGSNSLCLALERRPNDIAVLGMFLVSNPSLVKRNCDNSNNTPLHVACQRGSCLPIIRQLFQLHPPALFQRNENGKTPLDLLQQQAAVCNKAKQSLCFLQDKQQQLAASAMRIQQQQRP